MNKRVFKADILLLLTAAIWGFGFVAQRSGMQYVGPFAYNGIRFLLASLSLLPLIAWNIKKRGRPAGWGRPMFLSSIIIGSCLFLASTIQQAGVMLTTAGNAGFITGLYVIFTPVIGIFLGRKTGKATWLGAVLMLAGLYFLSARGPLGQINPGDIIVAVSAVFWAFHVLLIDRMVKYTDPFLISAGQFAVAGIFALAAAFWAEPFLLAWLETSVREYFPSALFYWKSLPALMDSFFAGAISPQLLQNILVPILYGGLVAAGAGFTLQVVAQRDAPPAHATIILCLEGGFAALGGILILHEPAGTRIIIGFALALAGMLASQMELIRGSGRK